MDPGPELSIGPSGCGVIGTIASAYGFVNPILHGVSIIKQTETEKQNQMLKNSNSQLQAENNALRQMNQIN